MQWQRHAGYHRKKAGDDVEQRRLLDERLTGQRWHDQVAALKKIQHDAEVMRFVRLPGIVTDQAEQHPSGHERDEPHTGRQAMKRTRRCDVD